MNQNSIKALSIQIRLSGLSFCILNRSESKVEWLKHIQLKKKVTPFEVLNELKSVIDSNSEFQQTFDSVVCVYQNELSCLVPKSLFDENALADYLKFNAKILKTDFISYDVLATNDCVNVYVPLVNINNYVFDTFGSFDYKHSSTILIENFLQLNVNTSKQKLCVNVNTSTFEIIFLDKEQLVFYNTFEFQTKEDFIYYILFTLEQLKLNPETIEILLSGNIESTHENYKILYQYVRFVDFIHPKYNYNLEVQEGLNRPHNNFILLNSFT